MTPVLVRVFGTIALVLVFAASASGLDLVPQHEPSPALSTITVKVVMDSKKPNGKAWDAFGGAPDPYVKIDGKSYRSSKCQDSYTCKIKIQASGSFSVEVWDADVSSDDHAGTTVCARGKACPTNAGAFVYVQ